jgi:hypothetical protein
MIIFRKIYELLKNKKKYWMIPILFSIALCLMLLLIAYGKKITPFAYSFF